MEATAAVATAEVTAVPVVVPMMVVQRWVQRRVQQRIAVVALHNARRSAGIVRAPRGYYCYAKTHWETSNQQPATEFTDLYGSTGVAELLSRRDAFSRA